MREINVESPCVALAERNGWWQRKVRWVGRKAAPDRVFVKGGRTIWIEFKRPGTPGARLLQELEHDEMREFGAEVYVVDSMRDFCDVMGIDS